MNQSHILQIARELIEIEGLNFEIKDFLAKNPLDAFPGVGLFGAVGNIFIPLHHDYGQEYCLQANNPDPRDMHESGSIDIYLARAVEQGTPAGDLERIVFVRKVVASRWSDNLNTPQNEIETGLGMTVKEVIVNIDAAYSKIEEYCKSLPRPQPEEVN